MAKAMTNAARAALNGVYRSLARGGAQENATTYFRVTRLAEDGRDAYGYHCTSVAGIPDAREPLCRVRLNLRKTAPQGFRPLRSRDYGKGDWS